VFESVKNRRLFVEARRPFIENTTNIFLKKSYLVKGFENKNTSQRLSGFVKTF